MTNVPTLMIRVGPLDRDEQVDLDLILSNTDTAIPGKLALPFRLAQVPLLLRALNARQYPDYPDRDRFFKADDERDQVIKDLKELGLWDGDENSGTVAIDVHSRVGRLLGAALLANENVRDIFNKLYDAAIKVREGEIVLDFGLTAGGLAALPWEVGYDNYQPLLLTKGVVLNCTRMIEFKHELPPPRPIGERLRVLTVAPAAHMHEIARAFEQLARSRMKEALKHSPVDIEALQGGTMEALYKRLTYGPTVDILDYYGHGILTEEGGALLFENPQGGVDPVLARRLAALPNLPPLIVLHACQSAQMVPDEPLASVAVTLSSAGARAVVATQLALRMTAATNEITPIFYQALASGQSVQRAVAYVRQKLYVEETDGASWYLPVLYLRQPHPKPYILLTRVIPPNPFAGTGALTNPNSFVGCERIIERLWERLQAGGNLSIVGPSGSGKSTLLALIAHKAQERLNSKPKVVRLPLQRDEKPIGARLMLARLLGGPKARATDLIELLADNHIILLLDDFGQLNNKGDDGLNVRLWLRELSQDRTHKFIQLVAASLRPLHEIFKEDNSPNYSPLHNVMRDIIELEPLNCDEARYFVTTNLAGTPFQPSDFADLIEKPIVPRELQEACRTRYDNLVKRQ